MEATSHGPRQSKLHTYKCWNERCNWYGTGWVVQEQADGSIPERPKGPKEFGVLSEGQKAVARRTLEQAAVEDPALMPEVKRIIDSNG